MNAEQVNKRPIKVKISTGGKMLVEVAQRDLFGKNGWPAEKEIHKALTKLKEETASA